MNDTLKSIMDKYDELHVTNNNFDIEKEISDYNDKHDPYDYRQILNNMEQ